MNLQSLKESILADAFERRAVTEFCLAERLIHERAWAAAEIERLTAENERLQHMLGVMSNGTKNMVAQNMANPDALNQQQATKP